VLVGTAVAACWFVREAWPSPTTGADCTAGLLTGSALLELTSESERLVVFADGLEDDRLEPVWDQRISLGIAERRLWLVVGAG